MNHTYFDSTKCFLHVKVHVLNPHSVEQCRRNSKSNGWIFGWCITFDRYDWPVYIRIWKFVCDFQFAYVWHFINKSFEWYWWIWILRFRNRPDLCALINQVSSRTHTHWIASRYFVRPNKKLWRPLLIIKQNYQMFTVNIQQANAELMFHITFEWRDLFVYTFAGCESERKANAKQTMLWKVAYAFIQCDVTGSKVKSSSSWILSTENVVLFSACCSPPPNTRKYECAQLHPFQMADIPNNDWNRPSSHWWHICIEICYVFGIR